MLTALEACLAELATALASDAIARSSEDLRRHATDASPLLAKRLQQGLAPPTAGAVIWPRSIEDVALILRAATAHRVPVTPWGAGSSVVGQPLPMDGGISLDLGRMTGAIDVNEIDLTVTLRAGTIGAEAEALLNRRGYTLHFSPQSLDRSTVGGWVATKATGQFSSRWGGIEDALVAVTAVLPDGEVLATRAVPRQANGPDMKNLLVGSEGTLAVVADVTLKIYPLDEHQALETLRFDALADGLASMREIMRVGLRPFLLRLYDQDEARHTLDDVDFRGACLMVGTSGLRSMARAEMRACLDLGRSRGGVSMGSGGTERWMSRRYDFSAVQSVLDRPGGVAETIEVSHSWSGILETYDAMRAALGGVVDEVLCHFSHAYTTGSSLYVIVLGEAATPADAERTLLEVWRRAMTACLSTGAAISHHHGVGRVRLPWLRSNAPSSLALFERIKAAIDPDSTLSPGNLAPVVDD